jgi:hypothetical protein
MASFAVAGVSAAVPIPAINFMKILLFHNKRRADPGAQRRVGQDLAGFWSIGAP